MVPTGPWEAFGKTQASTCVHLGFPRAGVSARVAGLLPRLGLGSGVGRFTEKGPNQTKRGHGALPRNRGTKVIMPVAPEVAQRPPGRRSGPPWPPPARMPPSSPSWPRPLSTGWLLTLEPRGRWNSQHRLGYLISSSPSVEWHPRSFCRIRAGQLLQSVPSTAGADFKGLAAACNQRASNTASSAAAAALDWRASAHSMRGGFEPHPCAGLLPPRGRRWLPRHQR